MELGVETRQWYHAKARHIEHNLSVDREMLAPFMNCMLCNVKGWWTRSPNWGKGRARGPNMMLFES